MARLCKIVTREWAGFSFFWKIGISDFENDPWVPRGNGFDWRISSRVIRVQEESGISPTGHFQKRDDVHVTTFSPTPIYEYDHTLSLPYLSILASTELM